MSKQTQEEKQDALANEIAKAVGEEKRIELFRYICRHNDEKIIKRALDETMKVPSNKIKKSRAALFFYLFEKYSPNKNAKT